MKPLEDKMMSIELKARQLIQAKQQLQKKVDLLETENNELKKLVEQQNIDLRKNKEINQIKHIAASLNDQEKKQTRQKINALVREIDHCIALLND